MLSCGNFIRQERLGWEIGECVSCQIPSRLSSEKCILLASFEALSSNRLNMTTYQVGKRPPNLSCLTQVTISGWPTRNAGQAQVSTTTRCILSTAPGQKADAIQTECNQTEPITPSTTAARSGYCCLSQFDMLLKTCYSSLYFEFGILRIGQSAI